MIEILAILIATPFPVTMTTLNITAVISMVFDFSMRYKIQINFPRFSDISFDF